MSTSRCLTETAGGTHHFMITDYSHKTRVGVGQSIASDTFRVGGYEWKIMFYPDGLGEDGARYVSVFLELQSTADNVKATFSFNIEDPIGGLWSPLYEKSDEPDVFATNTSWGYPKFMTMTQLEERYIIDDSITIQCDIEVIKYYRINVPPPNIAEHLYQLLESKLGVDVTLEVEETSFDAHKLVLAMRSPVFKAAFFGPMKEKDMRYMRIDDMEAVVFKALLHFIYTDMLPSMDDLVSDNAKKGITIQLTQNLLVAADRYHLERMALLCESLLCNDIDLENVATILKLADRHSRQHLKDFCMAYISSPEVLSTVMPTEDFENLTSSCPLILKQILEKVVAKYAKPTYTKSTV